MRILSIILLSLLISEVSGQTKQAPACVGCHRAQSVDQPQTPMGRALQASGDNPTLKAHPKLTFRKGGYSYSVDTTGDKTTYSVTDGVNTITLPVHWSFGKGAQTWFLERNGEYYESMVSYYPSINGLEITTGDDVLVPKTLEEAVGRKLNEREPKDCFGCHSSDAVKDGKLNLTSLEPGLTCEHCHKGSSAHLVEASQGILDSAPPSLRKMSSEDMSNFCGQCHRKWETVIRGPWRGQADVRFQPYRLANSKCFDGADPRISCVACHDPHRDLVREEAAYDGKCLACHGASHGATDGRASKNVAAKSCPVAKSNCVSCHMPKTKLPNGLMTFSDHEIRVVRPGEAYPN